MSEGKAAALPRHRPWSGIALFAHGFRPFFLAAGLWAVAALALWLAVLLGSLALPTAFDPLAWHVHEMLFGFVFAAVAGFLLTAVPNWTGRMPLQGWPLIGLAVLWAAGRATVAGSEITGPIAAAVIDLAFPLALLAVIAREVIAGRNWRNLPVLAAVLMLTVANALFHVEALGWAKAAAVGWRLGIATVTAMICLIGGRIVPSFTRNWLTRRGETRLPAAFSALDRVALLLVVLWGVLWTAWPMSPATSAMAVAAAAAHAVRLARWRGLRTATEPLLWVLHVGYFWVPVGLALLAAAGFSPTVPEVTGVHALTAGAMATMILAVTTRATLGHTGRDLTVGMGTATLYILITGAALTRIAATLVPDFYNAFLSLSGLAWLAAFAGFLGLYGPMMLRRRVDGKDG